MGIVERFELISKKLDEHVMVLTTPVDTEGYISNRLSFDNVSVIKVAGRRKGANIGTDVLGKLLAPTTAPITLSPIEKEEAAELIIGALRDSSSHSYKERMEAMEVRYAKMGTKLAKARAQLREAENENSYLTDTLVDQTRQIEDLKAINDKIEGELEEAFTEQFELDNRNRDLKDEVRSARFIL
jgi:hypothetical protein